MAININKQEGDKLHAEEWNELAQEVMSKQPRLNIVDGLDSDSSVDVLSAKQGKVLNEKINRATSTIEGISKKVNKLPTGYYYGQFDSVSGLPDVSQSTQKGYAYVASEDPSIYYIYLFEGEGSSWEDSGNKFVTTALEDDLSTKSESKAPTTKVVAEGIEDIDLISNVKIGSKELDTTQKYNANANINNRIADVVAETGVVRSLGYRVLNPNLSFAEQVNSANTIYEIKDSINIGGGSVTIPSNCTLKYNGGRLINGTIVGVDTLIVGDGVKFDKLEGSFVCPIYSTYSTMVADFEKIEMLLKLSIDSLYIDEDYTLTSLPRLVESTHINNIYGGGHEIKSTVDSVGVRVFELHVKHIEGLTFNYTEHDVVTPLKIFGVESLKIENINVKNINRTREVASGVSGVIVNIADGCVLNIDKFSAENLISNGNTTIGDGWGSVVGLYVNVGDKCSITINNASFEDIKNVEDGQEYLEDAGGLYVHYTNIAQNTSTLDINNLYGRNFGKRLLKTDARNITINNVEAYNTTDYCLAVLGLNAGDQPNKPSNLVIRNVYFEGRAQYVFAADMENVVIENATIKYDNTYTKFVSGISVSSVKSRTTVKNVTYSGKNMIILLLYENEAVVGFDSCVFNVEKLYVLTQYGNVDFKNCDFITNSGIVLTEAVGRSTSSIEFNKCNFECLGSAYEGILYNNAYLKVGSLVVKDSIFKVNNTSGIFNAFVEKKCVVENNQITFSENTSSHGNVKVIGTVENVANDDDLVCSLKNNVIVSTLKPSVYDYRVINHNTNKVKVDVDAGYRVILTDVYTDSPVIYYYTSTPQQIDGSRALINVSTVGRVDMTYDNGWTLSKPSTYTLNEAVLISTAKTMKVGASIFCSTINKPIYWNGSSWTDSNGETIGLQVSDTTVLIGATADSTASVNVYYPDVTPANPPTITVLNPDNTANNWLVATLTTNTLALTLDSTYGANTATSPRGAKIIVTLDAEVVIINVVQAGASNS